MILCMLLWSIYRLWHDCKKTKRIQTAAVFAKACDLVTLLPIKWSDTARWQSLHDCKLQDDRGAKICDSTFAKYSDAMMCENCKATCTMISAIFAECSFVMMDENVMQCCKMTRATFAKCSDVMIYEKCSKTTAFKYTWCNIFTIQSNQSHNGENNHLQDCSTMERHGWWLAKFWLLFMMMWKQV